MIIDYEQQLRELVPNVFATVKGGNTSFCKTRSVRLIGGAVDNQHVHLDGGDAANMPP